MKKVKFNNKEYQAPEYWRDVSVNMLIKAGELGDMLPDAPIIAIISAYCGIPVRELTVAKQDEVQEIMNILEFIYTGYTPTPTNEFDFRNEHYECELDLINQSFGDWVSVQTILYNYRENPLRGLSRMIAVLCKKPSETIDMIDVDARAELFMDLPMTIAKDIESFFLSRQISYGAIFQLSSTIPDMEKSIRSQLIELKRIIKAQKVRTGGSLRMRLLIGYYQIYLWYLTSLWERYFSSTPTEVSRRNWKQIVKKLFISPVRRKPNENS